MNKRLLTDKEIKDAIDTKVEENFFKERPPRYGAEQFVAKAQDAKTLKAVGEWLLDGIDDSGKIVTRQQAEDLKQGRMPE